MVEATEDCQDEWDPKLEHTIITDQLLNNRNGKIHSWLLFCPYDLHPLQLLQKIYYKPVEGLNPSTLIQEKKTPPIMVNLAILFRRRVRFFEYRQRREQSYSSFRVQLALLAKAAALDQMSSEDLMAVRIFTAAADSEFKRKVLQLESPSLEEVDRLCPDMDLKTDLTNLARAASIEILTPEEIMAAQIQLRVFDPTLRRIFEERPASLDLAEIDGICFLHEAMKPESWGETAEPWKGQKKPTLPQDSEEFPKP